MALTVIQAPPTTGDSDSRSESVSPSTTLRMPSKQPRPRPPSPCGSVLLTSTTGGGEQPRRVTAPQPPHVSLQVMALRMNRAVETGEAGGHCPPLLLNFTKIPSKIEVFLKIPSFWPQLVGKSNSPLIYVLSIYL